MTNNTKKCVMTIILLITGDVCSLPHNIRQRESLMEAEDAADTMKDKTLAGEDHSHDPISSETATSKKHDPEESVRETPIQPQEHITTSDDLRQEGTQETNGEDVSLRGGLLPSKTTSKQTTTPIGGLPTLPSLPPLPPLPPFPSGGSAMGPMAVLGGFSALIMPLSGMGNVFTGLPSILGQLSSLPSFPTIGG